MLMGKINVNELIHGMDELEYYNLIKMEKKKGSDPKENRFQLNVDV